MVILVYGYTYSRPIPKDNAVRMYIGMKLNTRYRYEPLFPHIMSLLLFIIWRALSSG